MMPADKPACTNCGHRREQTDKDYLDLHPERRNIIPKEGDLDE